MTKNVLLVLIGVFWGGLFFAPRAAIAEQIKSVFVENFPEVQRVEVVNDQQDGFQKWEYWYQCHPNPTNENEIRGYLNDRGQQGLEVVGAAATNGVICEYYKRPIQN
jgi:hypothetical protein